MISFKILLLRFVLMISFNGHQPIIVLVVYRCTILEKKFTMIMIKRIHYFQWHLTQWRTIRDTYTYNNKRTECQFSRAFCSSWSLWVVTRAVFTSHMYGLFEWIRVYALSIFLEWALYWFTRSRLFYCYIIFLYRINIV